MHIYFVLFLPMADVMIDSGEQDKPVIHIYDGRGCEKSAVTSLSQIHSSPIISMKV